MILWWFVHPRRLKRRSQLLLCCVFVGRHSPVEPDERPSLSLSVIYGQAVSTARPAHVTVLMLKNALVNINRPGRQDKFAFMPEEEKTSVSLTQRPPRVGGAAVVALCVPITPRLMFLDAGQQLQTLPHREQPFYVGHCDTSSLCVKYHNRMKMALWAPNWCAKGRKSQLGSESPRWC